MNSTFGNFLVFMITAVLICTVGTTLGYFCGVMFDDDSSTRMLANFIMIFFMLTSGALSNASHDTEDNWLVSNLSYISPPRYSCEAYFRVFTEDSPFEQYALDKFGYNYGLITCLLAMVGSIVLLLVLAMITIYLRNRKL